MADVGLRDDVWEFVPFVPRLKADFFGVENAEAISRQLRAIVEDYQARGWELVRLEQVEVLHTAGCLASLFGKSSVPVSYDLIVFRARRGTVKQSPVGKSSNRAVMQADEDDWEDGVNLSQAGVNQGIYKIRFGPSIQRHYDELRTSYSASREAPDGSDDFFPDAVLGDMEEAFFQDLESFVSKLGPQANAKSTPALLSMLERDFPEIARDRRFVAATGELRRNEAD